MLGSKKEVSYTKLKTAMENDILQRYPTIAKHIDAIHVEKAHMSADVRSSGIGIAVSDSKCMKEALPIGVQPQQAIRYEEPSAGTKKYIDKAMDSAIKSGLSQEDAFKKVKDSLISVMGFDPATKQYVISARAPEKEAQALGVTDSLLEQTSIQMWVG